MSLSFVQGTPILLYGGGKLSRVACRRLLEQGYSVAGILDQQAPLITDMPVPVFYPEQAPFLEDACVCICLYNGLQHMHVAQALSRRGYQHILTLPLELSSRAARQLMGQYQTFISGSFEEIGDIPSFDSLWDVCCEDYYLREDGRFATVMIPTKHIYTTLSHYEPGHPYDGYVPDRPHKAPSRLVPNSPLGTSEVYAEQKLRERPDLYSFFERALRDGLDYFIDAAPPARLHESGHHFNLMDGHHRCSFLYYKGFDSLPLQVDKEEYRRYFRPEWANHIMKQYRERGRLPASVIHPAFQRMQR